MIGRYFFIEGQSAKITGEFGTKVFNKTYMCEDLQDGSQFKVSKSEFIRQYKSKEIYELKTAEEIAIAKLS